MQTHCVGNGLLRYFPFLQFDARVVSCKSASRTVRSQTGKRKVEGFEVVCQDTVLFPEGGGQVRNKSYQQFLFSSLNTFVLVEQRPRHPGRSASAGGDSPRRRGRSLCGGRRRTLPGGSGGAAGGGLGKEVRPHAAAHRTAPGSAHILHFVLRLLPIFCCCTVYCCCFCSTVHMLIC